MASVIRVGTKGSVTMADTSGAAIATMTIGTWSASFPRPESDTTPFSPTGNARTAIGGNRSISGSFSGLLDGTTPIDLTDYNNSEAVEALITLIYNLKPGGGTDQQKVSFNGWLSNIDIGVTATGEPNTISADFTGTGAATWAQAASGA